MRANWEPPLALLGGTRFWVVALWQGCPLGFKPVCINSSKYIYYIMAQAHLCLNSRWPRSKKFCFALTPLSTTPQLLSEDHNLLSLLLLEIFQTSELTQNLINLFFWAIHAYDTPFASDYWFLTHSYCKNQKPSLSARPAMSPNIFYLSL